ncbi:hypothetical protein SAMN05444287_0876 [Octadecabacter temperatus]|uniref:Uncharacterized protein n=1 Tax=Octadecabacter temperatus TaxID=1458307 RepID=A0A0K0Y4K1_9RHOB|nr:hypothetical protein [Octadecabacter temperatus]AKS45777.1 hypothetical protein OSB_12220 [Octadecabacter temperatus]SIO00289.1 hypothetical protein SAMN05444287_0876 [Octadecabacter temperatus]
MTLAASDTGNLFLALAALAGLLILQAVICARDPWAPLNRRFLLGLRVMAMLFAGRALLILTGWDFFRFFILLGATLIPLSVLLLAEGLLRRHAPLGVKFWVMGGTILFSILSFWWSNSVDPLRLVGLLAFQLSGFFIGAWLVLTRNKASLTVAENQTVERLALSLFLLVPFAAADFLMDYLDLPAQISPLGVLFLCWLAVSLGRSQSQHRAPLVSFFAIVLGAGLSGFVIAHMVGMDKDATILTLVVILAAVLVAVLFIEAQTLRSEEQSQTLLRHLAEDRSRDALGFLRGLQAHPLVEGAALIEATQLSDLETSVLKHIFKVRPVLRRADPPFTDGAEGDHIKHLFSMFNASHILLADDEPITLVALSMPSLATSPRAELELAAVQRMARLMTKARP